MVRGIFLIWVLLLAGSAFGAEKGLAVKVRAVEGGVTISLDGGKVWRKAKPGAVLKAGTRLRTGADGKADVEFGKEYALVRLRGDSDFEVRSHRDADGIYETEAALRSGSILGTIKDQSIRQMKFELEGPKWICGVRGLDGFDVMATGGGKALKGTTLIFIFTGFEPIFENTFVVGGYAARVEGTRQRPDWVEREMGSGEYEALAQEITGLRKKYWKK